MPAKQTESSNEPEVRLKTSITIGSLSRNFGPPGGTNFRAHPNQKDGEDPLHIFRAMVQKEIKNFTSVDEKMLKGTIYSQKNRRIITKWIRDVCAAFDLKSTTLYMAIQLTDDFLIAKRALLPVSECQLAAIANVWIAAKFEEMDDKLPYCQALVDVCDKAYSADQIVAMEEAVLEHFKWKIPYTCVMNFLSFILHLHTDKGYMGILQKKGQPAMNYPLTFPVRLLKFNDETKEKSTVVLEMQSEAPLLNSVQALCAAVGLVYTPSVEIFELVGSDLLLGRRLNLAMSPKAHQLGPSALLFVSSGGSTNVFVENSEAVILKSINFLFIHVCECLLDEAVIYVDFLHYRPHEMALAAVSLTRCIIGTNFEEAALFHSFTLQLLRIHSKPVRAAADLLQTRFQAADAATISPPVVSVPSDIQERMSVVFNSCA